MPLIFFKILLVIVPVLIAVAFFTVAERKIMGAIQRRRGPNVVGFFGLFQALADGLKLFLKETVLPSSSNKFLFVLAPVLTFFISLLGWAVMPLNVNSVFVDLNLGTLFLFAISSLGVYGIIIAGWSSNSKYAFLGALRSAAQIISYEVSIGFIVVAIIISSGTTNLTEIVFAQRHVWFCFPLFPIFILFFISCLAETNRHPFDLPEAEAELVSGYNVEYSAIGFALFFLGEYSNMLIMSVLTTLFFLGGWLFPIGFFSGSLCFSLKSFLFISLFIWIRAAFPRYRYDQLIRLGWKVFLPFSMSWIIFTAGVLLGLNWLVLTLNLTFLVT
jgi:NADH-quinone oxidoreductase subunit H